MAISFSFSQKVWGRRPYNKIRPKEPYITKPIPKPPPIDNRPLNERVGHQDLFVSVKPNGKYDISSNQQEYERGFIFDKEFLNIINKKLQRGASFVIKIKNESSKGKTEEFYLDISTLKIKRKKNKPKECEYSFKSFKCGIDNIRYFALESGNFISGIEACNNYKESMMELNIENLVRAIVQGMSEGFVCKI